MDDLIGAVDIGGSKVALGFVTLGGKVRTRRELPTAALCRAGEQGLDRVRAVLSEMALEVGGRLCGIGVGCTGPVDPETGRIGTVGTIPGWNGLNLTGTFSAFGVPIAVENDADASALAEAAWGSGRDAGKFIYVTIGTGIGCGLVFDGVLYRGAGGGHPEIGHHILDCGGPRCYCGANGCWEALASGVAIASWYRGETGCSELTARDVCVLARSGDEAAIRAVARVARYLGAGMSNLITIFAPGTMALGGGLMRSWDLFESQAAETIRKCCTQVPAARTKIVPAELGTDLPLLGAARSWIQRYG